MPALLKEFSIIALLVIIGSAYSLWSGLAPWPTADPLHPPGSVGIEEARAMDPIWVDTRSWDEFTEEHISDAIWLSEDAWDSGLIDLMEHWIINPRPIVVYCSSESCGTSARVADRLRGEPMSESGVFVLYGGWEAWKQ